MVSQCLKNEACANSNGLTTVYSVPLLHNKVYHLKMLPNPDAAKVPMPNPNPTLVATAPELENEVQGEVQVGIQGTQGNLNLGKQSAFNPHVQQAQAGAQGDQGNLLDPLGAVQGDLPDPLGGQGDLPDPLGGVQSGPPNPLGGGQGGLLDPFGGVQASIQGTQNGLQQMGASGGAQFSDPSARQNVSSVAPEQQQNDTVDLGRLTVMLEQQQRAFKNLLNQILDDQEEKFSAQLERNTAEQRRQLNTLRCERVRVLKSCLKQAAVESQGSGGRINRNIVQWSN